MIQSLDREALAGLLQRGPLRRLLIAFNRDGEETRIVGGAVRNARTTRLLTGTEYIEAHKKASQIGYKAAR